MAKSIATDDFTLSLSLGFALGFLTSTFFRVALFRIALLRTAGLRVVCVRAVFARVVLILNIFASSRKVV